MTYRMYSVKDELTGKFMSPMFTENLETADQDAIRQFKSNMLNIKLWYNNCNDYSLWFVGIFDDEAGASSVPLNKIIDGRSIVNGEVQKEN